MTEIIQPIFQTAAWVVIHAFVPAFIVMNAVLIAGAFLTYVERKVIGHIQLRPGPNRVGPLGLLQPLADGIKLLTKEDIIPAQADRFVFVIAPFFSLVPVIMAYAVIPWGEPTTIMGVLPWLRAFDGWGYIPPAWNPFPLVPEKATLVVSNLNIGVLYILAMSGLSAYGIILA
ncbi:MAG: NADH-quinone oxidoreductase subunit H, partial [Nitrospirae bacterium]|nr:NADH-quinone oxidoreductase subunit H [Nitrospirota bacterium]